VESRVAVAMPAAALAPPAESEADLIAAACALAGRERNAPAAVHFRRNIAEIGRALGYEARAEEGPDGGEVRWARGGAPARRILVRQAAPASLLLRALPGEGAPPCTVVVVGPDGLPAKALAASREVLSRSRPHLREGDLTIVLAPPAALPGRVWVGDLKADVIGAGRLRELPTPGRLVAAHPGRDLGDFPLFPYARVRDGQRAMLRDVRAAVAAGKVLVAHAPTGIGKTAAVLAAALDEARARGKTVFFLTSRQTQHQVALRTLRDMGQAAHPPARTVDLVSKQSMCPRPERPEHSGAFYEWCAHVCETKRCRYFLKSAEPAREAILDRIMDVEDSVKSSARMGVCPHKAAMDAAKDAEVVVCDYNTLFDGASAALDRLGLDPGDLIVVVDEAHNLAPRIRDASGGRVTHALLAEAYAELQGQDPELAFGVQVLTKAFEAALGKAPDGRQARLDGDDLSAPLAKALSSSLTPTTFDDFAKDLAAAGRKVVAAHEGRSATLELAEFLRAWQQPAPDTLRTADKTDVPSIAITLLDPAVVAGPLFARFHAAVLMSGTLYPMALTADLLGIPPARRMLESYPSPFLAGHRPVLLLRGVSTRYKDRGRAMFDKIAAGVAATCRATPGNVAAFFPSYKLCEEVGDRLPHRLKGELIVERREMSKGEKDRLVAHLRKAQAKGGALLLGVMGGSFSEGVDFYGGILDAVVVVGLPLAPPSMEVDTLVAYFDRKVGAGKGETYAYLGPAITRVLQAAGRLIRSEEDRGVVVLMDERLEQGRYARLFPPDFAPRPFDDPEDLARAVTAFFDAGA
jgi:DNA excision repair protein ERCC-2